MDPVKNSEPTSNLTADDAAATPEAVAPTVPEKLSAEEQMKRFEEELRENDWGHQPC